MYYNVERLRPCCDPNPLNSAANSAEILYVSKV